MDAKGAKDPLGRHHAIRVIPSESLLSSRAKLVCHPERSFCHPERQRGICVACLVAGRATGLFEKIPRCHFAATRDDISDRAAVLRGLGVLRVLGGLLLPLGRRTAPSAHRRVLCGQLFSTPVQTSGSRRGDDGCAACCRPSQHVVIPSASEGSAVRASWPATSDAHEIPRWRSR